MSIRRQPMRAPEPEEMKGKYKDTMKGMFDNKGRNSESFHAELLRSLEDNKKRYDKQLYSDWLIKVYGRCTNICIKPQVEYEDDEAPSFVNGKSGKVSLLREVEKQCARNCMRKFDRTYKTFDQVEKNIFDQFITDENIDPSSLLKAMQRQEEDQNARDMAEGEKLVDQGKI
ncbi:hypothetical protein FGO68_gene5289 [Halteria grandinella]|uniref:Uncharacterized protein n=1 Tax=Halteria grandinella TaxID=5974 RepID=A0A8J8T678_HALGN|nr:hypothetical protein FGO68_gene5289 [Halteria grandinella]